MTVSFTPCVGICEADLASGFCRGCARTLDEIGQWRDFDESRRDEVWRRLPERRRASGLGHRLLPVEDRSAVEFVREALASPEDAWAIVLPGMAAIFARRAGEAAEVDGDGLGGRVVTPRGGVRVRLARSPRLFALAGEDDGCFGSAPRIAFAWHAVRFSEPGRRKFARIGDDVEALREGDRQAPLFDLGLAQPHAALFLRPADAAAESLLSRLVGRAAKKVLADSAVARAMAAGDVHMVAVSPLGRIEILQPSVDGPRLEQGVAACEGVPCSYMSCLELIRPQD